jgi:hypothetical protein
MKKIDLFVLQKFSFLSHQDNFLKKLKNEYINFSLTQKKKKKKFYKRFFSKTIICQQHNENFLYFLFFLNKVLPLKWRKKVKIFFYMSTKEREKKIFGISGELDILSEIANNKTHNQDKKNDSSLLSRFNTQKKKKKYILLIAKSIKYSKKIHENLNRKNVNFLKNALDLKYINKINLENFKVIQDKKKNLSRSKMLSFISKTKTEISSNFFPSESTYITSKTMKNQEVLNHNSEEKNLYRFDLFLKRHNQKIHEKLIKRKKKKYFYMFLGKSEKFFSHSFFYEKILGNLNQNPIK